MAEDEKVPDTSIVETVVDVPDNETDETELTDESTTSFPIDRDASFVRLHPDLALVIERSSDVEVALIVQGPDPAEQFVQTFSSGLRPHHVRMKVSYSEIARLRLETSTAVQMAMQLLARAIHKEEISPEILRQAIDAMIQEVGPTADTSEATPSA